MFRAPAAWLRSSQVPACAQRWPSAIGAVFAGDRGPVADRVRALESFAGDRWVGWLLPLPSTWRALAPRVLEVCAALGAAGVVIDPEAEWKADDRNASGLRPEEMAEEARAFVDYFQSRGVHVVLCTYALPPASFPLEAFGAAKAGIAQTYDRDVRLDDGYLEQSRARWRARGWSAQWVPSVGLWNHSATPQRVKTPDELRRHLEQRPRDSVVWGPSVWSTATCAALERWQSQSAREPTTSAPTQAAIAAALVALFTWLSRQ